MSEFRHIYVHIPFCEVICHYCHFYTARSAEADQPLFFSALEKEAQNCLPRLAPQLDAIYLGGGTPGASDPLQLRNFLSLFSDRIGPHTEITLETNPVNVTASSVRAWKEAGFNRISLGVQSLNDTLLQKLGRRHSAAEAIEATELCLQEIPNVSIDLLYGVPGQTAEEPARQARQMNKLGVPHLSAYHLSLETNHFMHPHLPGDAFAWQQIKEIADSLEPLGYHHYEIASFGLPGKESRNNRNYWSGGPYAALGPSAHGFDGSRQRWRNISDWREYSARIHRGESPLSASEELTLEQRRIEVIFTSLRTSEGLDLARFQGDFGEDLRDTRRALFQAWEKEGLGRVTNGHFVLSFSGRMLGDEIAKRLF